MRVSREEKDRSRERIVAGAARLTRERGVERTGVADVMRDAGLTHGGFYRHFDTKEALIGAALEAAFDQILARLEPRTAASASDPDQAHRSEAEAAAAVADFVAFYLSDEHANAPSLGCPVAALGGDVARGSTALRTTFGAGVRRSIAALAQGRPGKRRDREARAAREFAMLAGAVMIARASDPETARTVLAACRNGLDASTAREALPATD